MNQFKRVKMVMLPTGESNLSINRSYKERGIGVEVGKPYLTYCKTFKYYSSVTDNSCNPQHLYIISDDTFVKKGEWYYDRFSKTIKQCTSLSYQSNVVKKIIATTDTSLKIPRKNSHPNSVWKLDGALLPQPSQQFIEKYIEEYNKGNVITDVLVEYESNEEELVKLYNKAIDRHLYKDFNQWLRLGDENYTLVNRIKVNPKDNTITIKKIKDSWDEKELDFEFNKLLGDLLINKRNKDLINNPNSNKISEYITNWIKENL